MALILGIETGTNVCSVAVMRDGKVVALRESGEGLDHARKLSVYTQEVLRASGVGAKELDAVAVSKGPGSYTGLRIGVSTAKGLCYALGIPLISVGSAESLAWVLRGEVEEGRVDIRNWGNAWLCPMIDARRMEVYAQVFDVEVRPETDVEAYVVEKGSFAEYTNDGKPFVMFGDGAGKCREVIVGENVVYVDVAPSAKGLAVPAHDAFVIRRFENVAYFEPLYLKEFMVTTSKKKLF